MCLPAIEWVSHSFIDVSRSVETPGLEKKESLLVIVLAEVKAEHFFFFFAYSLSSGFHRVT